MSWKLPGLALALFTLQVLEVLILGTSPTGAFLANSLQVMLCGVAAAATLGAYRRGCGLSRPFWMLVSLGIATWGVANLGWMYYENWLHAPVPRFSVVRFVFDAQGVFFAIALFLDKERDSAGVDLETLLDSLQIAIVFFSAFFGLYYVQVLSGVSPSITNMFMTWIYDVINVTLTLLASLLLITAQTPRLRWLYGGLAAFMLTYTIGPGIADYMQTIGGAQTGTWYDVLWTTPFLVATGWTSGWREPADTAETNLVARRKTAGTLAIKHVMLALAPLIVLVLTSQLAPQWRGLGFVLLGVSIVCYAARLGLTEFRKTQAADTARRQRLALDSTMDGMAILDRNGRHVYVNSAFARMTGYGDAETILDKRWREIFNEGDVARWEAEILGELHANGKWFGALTIHRKDGSALPIEMAVTALPDGGIVCVSRDIAERMKAEQARMQAEAKYRTLVEQVSAISYIAELGVDGEWFYVSPQITSMTGFSPEEWLADSKSWIKYVHPEDHALIAEAEEASRRCERFQAEYRIFRKDGSVMWVSDTAVVVPGIGTQQLMEGIIVDITERKQFEGQLQQSRRMEAVGRLAGGIAHDFNNLLTIIKGYTEIALTRSKGQPELNRDIEHIEDASERATTLVRQLLAFSRRQVLQPKVLDLNRIVLGLDKLLRRLMDEHVEMRTVVGEKIGSIRADPAQIEQVVMNLVVNARDAMPNGGRLTIETADVDLDMTYARDHVSVKPGKYVMLAVTDTGIGMSPDTVGHIFEPFYSTKESGHGTGLGLSTVYGIVKQSGGYIWVYSEVGHGSSFKVYFPRVDEPAEALQKGRSPVAQRKGTETILLVEDEPEVRELTRMVLAAQGYYVIEAASPEDAERICENDGAGISLLLTDVIMPGMSGRELAKRITAQHPKMKVLYMSGYTYNVIAQGGMLETGIAFLQKPFTPTALTEKVREILDRNVSVR